MTAPAHGEFAARMGSLDEALDFVEAFCAACAVAIDDVLRLRLVVEELFTNTVRHGHGGDCDSLIRIELVAAADRLHVCYVDQAPPFDPLRAPAAADPAGQLRVGGVGLRLVAELASNLDYARDGERNRLRFELVARLTTAPPISQ